MKKEESTRRRKQLRIPSGAPEEPKRTKPSTRYQRRKRAFKEQEDEDSFWCLFLRVAFMLALVFFVIGVVYTHYHVVGQINAPDDDGMIDGKQEELENSEDLRISTKTPHQDDVQQGEESMKGIVTATPIEETLPPLPTWDLSEHALQYDAFAVAEKRSKNNTSLFWQMAAGLRNEFAETYGGIDVARGLLDRASTNFGGGVEKTACRLQQARTHRRPFRFAFGGYSVTTGRGNYFSQSFPLVMEKKLHSIFHEVGIDLMVRNAAIGGCPSFPYGWCLRNFWGESPIDAVSWDFSMNEAGGDPAGFEAYLRRMMQIYSPHVPQLLMIDTSMAIERRNVLDYYKTYSLVVHRDEAIAPFLALSETARPNGFRDWRKFGAPPGAPGQSYHHPAVKEHELIAWILVMHFVSALEILQESSDMNCPVDPPVHFETPLVFRNASSESKVYPRSILFGQESSAGYSSSWTMNPVQCWTSFEPILAGNLSNIVVGGGIGEYMNIMLPKSKMFYNQGWVLDLSEKEKKAKRNLDRFGGLGFIDSKRSYYGIFASGTISFRCCLWSESSFKMLQFQRIQYFGLLLSVK